jgi:formylglycine-generating enzyme required for sulfatase activity
MTSDPPLSEFFTAGGTLSPDAPSYVHRPTDDELYRNIKAGEFCYVLTPRQMGKSSLMIRTAQRLMDEGIRSAIVDLTQTGTVESEDQWYKGILSQIQRRLRMKLDPVQWWEQRKGIPNVQKFIEFFEEALVEVREHVVIFMDEIDTTLKLDFRDNFFAGIRALYNARAENPDLRRITFVLLGVASPSDLIKDRSRTPFNIGQEIPLRPFSRQSASMLEQGLEACYPGLSSRILDRVFYWTNGHPYLTQKICQRLVDEPVREYSDQELDQVVEQLFISEEASRETNLQFVRESVLNPPDRRDNLSLYKKILQGKEIRDNRNSVSQSHLKLAGLARVDDGRLVVSNRIYARVFDLAWVLRYTEVRWSRVIAAVLAILVTLLTIVIYHDGMYLPEKSQKNIDNLAIYKDDRGIHYMAELFQMAPLFVPNEYEYKAKDIYFNTFSRQDQMDLIEIDEYKEKAPTNRQEFSVVVTGLYTSLADVDRSGQTSALLEAMRNSLEVLGLRGALHREIDLWLAARISASKGDLQAAVQNYTAAIGVNAKNPATHFERARIYAQQGAFDNALKDYDQVISIVPKSDMEPTSIPTSASVNAVSGTFTPRPLTPTLVTTNPLTPTAPAQTSGIPTLATAVTSSTSAAATPVTPAVTQTAGPIQPRFLTSGQRVAAVLNDLKQNQALIALLLKAKPGDYPNLEGKGLIQLAKASVVTVSARVTGTVTSEVSVPAASDGMVQIPAGNYEVGLSPADDYHTAPQTLSLDSFWIDQYLVTNGQYAQFVSATGAATPGTWPGEKDHPVRGVTWDQASAYCAWLNKRLPSEAEWEAAGRGPGRSPFLYPWGNDPTDGGLDATLSDADTYPVGSLMFNQSIYEVYDLVSNVWQWVGQPYEDIQSENKILRGGRFGIPVVDLAYRLTVAPGDVRYTQYAGFRCAAEAVSQQTVLGTSTPTQAGDFLYKDDFTNPASGWPEDQFDNYYIGYHQPEFYHVDVASPNYRTSVFAPGKQTFEDATIELSAMVDSSKSAENGDFRYGVDFRRSGDKYYTFTISPSTKKWFLLKSTPNSLSVLLQGTSNKILGPDIDNLLRVDALGSAFSLSINGELVGQWTDAEYASGEVGLYVETFDSPNVHVHFDSLDVRQYEAIQPDAVPPAANATATAASSPAPVILETTTSADGVPPQQEITALVQFRDHQGDASNILSELVSKSISSTLPNPGAPIVIPPAQQMAGTTIPLHWKCSGSGEGYTVTFDIFIEDQAGNRSEPYEVTFDCTVPSRSPTIAPTQIPMLFLDRNSYCRVGPGGDYPTVTAFEHGQRFPIIGQSANGWWLVQIDVPPSGHTSCWIFGNTPEGDTSSVPVH